MQAAETRYGYCQCGCGEKTGIAVYARAETGWVRGEPKPYIHGHHQRGKSFAAHPRQHSRFEVIDGKPCAWVPLTRNKWALIDAGDYDVVAEYFWYVSGNGYACRDTTDGCVFMHQALCICDPGLMPDHVNGDKLDNRRANLRPVNKAQNGWNARLSSRNRSGYKGVRLFRTGKWVARIHCNGVEHHLGYFDAKEEAIAARVEAETRLFGEYRRTV